MQQIEMNIVVKWGKETYNVEVSDQTTSDELRAQLYSLTNVPVDKQKIMGFKGGLLKAGVTLASAGLTDGLKVTLMGTAEERQLTNEVKAEVIFQEDLDAQKRKELIGTAVGAATVGLTNLGNTCYMNSTIQFLRPAAPLVQAIEKDSGATSKLLKGTLNALNTGSNAHTPMPFVMGFKAGHPQFSNNEQQDAEEFLQALQGDLQDVKAANGKPALEDTFGFNVETELKPVDAADGLGPEFNVDAQQKLSVFCGNQTTPVNHLHEGLRLALEESLTKRVESLGRDVAFKKTTRVASLPPYLMTHMVRFEWKQAHVLAGTEAGKAKICRKISFPVKLDLWEFFSAGLKKKLTPVRDILTFRNEKATMVVEPSGAEGEGTANAAAAEVEGLQEWNGLKAGVPIETGFFDLCSIVTHIGASADSGHYIGWQRKHVLDTAGQEPKETDPEPTTDEKWVKFDDDKVSELPFKECYLEGGHQNTNCAYLLMFRRRVITPTAEEILYAKKSADGRMIPDGDVDMSNVNNTNEAATAANGISL